MSDERRPRGRPPYPDVLTPAEWRVLEQVRKGLTNAEIAERLGVSIHTVKFHVSNVLSKTGAGTREALASWDPAGARRRRFGGLEGLIALTKSTLSWRIAAAVGLTGAGLVGFATIAAMSAGGEDPDGQANAAQPSPTPDPVPDVSPSLTVTSFELTQHEISDVRTPGFPSRAWEGVRTIRHGTTGETAESVEYLAPRQEQRHSLERGTKHWTWGADLQTVIEWDFAGSGATSMGPQLPGWPYGESTLREIVEHRAFGRATELLREEMLAGRPVYVIQIEGDTCAPEESADVAGPITLWVDRETLFVLKEEQRSRADDRVTMLREVTQIAYNPPFTGAEFAIPSGLPVEVMKVAGAGSTASTPVRLKDLEGATQSTGTDGVQPCAAGWRLEWVTPPADALWELVTATATPAP